ncbi:hypothetical protein ANN_14638 [Periplaneta americana]|uniref:Uncharacterized protein n=1 Tax=Periplaneta americana TaxID=6978 RepID=A0ABQ8SY91_PERAM|nr:hypothetical protein ANN_14638 [Periplaneta americana]
MRGNHTEYLLRCLLSTRISEVHEFRSEGPLHQNRTISRATAFSQSMYAFCTYGYPSLLRSLKALNFDMKENRYVYIECYGKIMEVIYALDSTDSSAVADVKSLSSEQLLEDILFNDSNFKIVSKSITLLELFKLQLSEALNIVYKVSQTVIQNNNSVISEKVKCVRIESVYFSSMSYTSALDTCGVTVSTSSRETRWPGFDSRSGQVTWLRFFSGVFPQPNMSKCWVTFGVGPRNHFTGIITFISFRRSRVEVTALRERGKAVVDSHLISVTVKFNKSFSTLDHKMEYKIEFPTEYVTHYSFLDVTQNEKRDEFLIFETSRPVVSELLAPKPVVELDRSVNLLMSVETPEHATSLVDALRSV